MSAKEIIWGGGKKGFFFVSFHIRFKFRLMVTKLIYVIPQTSAEIMFTPYSRQMQLWPMTRSTLCLCRTNTLRRWRLTRCSATATNPGDSEDASWVSSKRWWDTFGLLLFEWCIIDIGTYWLCVDEDNRSGVWTFVVMWDLDIYSANQSYPHTKKTEPW